MLQSIPGAAQDAPTLLVVEDEAVVAMDIAGQLRDMGYRVCGCVDNGRDAIVRARADRPDLVLMDVVLRGDMDGIAAAATIGAELQIPILFLTAYSDDQTVDRAAGAMPYGYLTKPFQGRELRAVIEVALRKAEVERALRDKERWLGSVLHGVGDAVIALGADGLVGLANPAAESLLGTKQANVQVWLGWRKLLHPAQFSLDISIYIVELNARAGRCACLPLPARVESSDTSRSGHIREDPIYLCRSNLTTQ